MSDWLAVEDRAAGVVAGLHLQMPGGPTVAAVVAAVESGRLAEARLDDVVRELLAFVLAADAARVPDATFDEAAHHRLARRAATASMVLLKNEGGLLPITTAAGTEIALIGAFSKAPRFQGAGSSEVVPTKVENVHDELVALLGSEPAVIYAVGYGDGDEPDPALLREAQAVAGRATVAVVVVGLPPVHETEGIDRTHIDLPPAHTALVEAVLAVQPRTAVVLVNGSAVAMPWAARVPVILEAGLGGQAAGGAIADVLLGRVNPSAKLAETFPVRLADTPAFLSFPHDGQGRTTFTEGIFAGYRWYDARDVEPLFPFGHGLSYTTFDYADLTLDKTSVRDTNALAVSLRLRNTGTRAGHEVVQLYVRERRPRLPRPDRELKAFAKVALAPGAETTVRFTLGERDFAFYDPRAHAWTTTSGVFDLLVGASSRDIRLQQSVTLESTRPVSERFDRLTPIGAWLAHPVGRGLLGPLLAAPSDADGAGSFDATALPPWFLEEMPVGKLVLLGVLDEETLGGTIDAANQPNGESRQSTNHG